MLKINYLNQDYFFSLVSQSARYLVQGLYFLILAFILDLEQFGKIAYIHGMGMILAIAIDNGSQLRVLLDIPKLKNDSDYIKIDILSRLVLCLSVIPLVLLISLLRFDIYLETIFYVLALLVQVTLYHFGNILKATFRYKIEAILNNVSQYSLLIFIGILAFMEFEATLMLISFFYFISRLFMLITYLYAIDKSIFLSKQNVYETRHFKYNKYFFKRGFPLGVLTLLAVFYVNIDAIIVSELLGDSYSGTYQIYFKFLMATMIIPEALNPILIDRLTKLYKTGNILKLKSFLLKIGVILIILSLFASLVYVNITRYLPYLIIEFEKLDLILIWMFVGVICLRYIGVITGNLLLIYTKHWYRVKILTISIILGVIINLLFLQQGGIKVAVVSLLISHLFLNISYLYKCLKTTKELIHENNNLL